MISQQDLIRRAHLDPHPLSRNPHQRIRRHGSVRAPQPRGNNNRGGGTMDGGSGGGNRLQMLVQGPDIEQLQIYVVALMEKLQDDSGRRRREYELRADAAGTARDGRSCSRRRSRRGDRLAGGQSPHAGWRRTGHDAQGGRRSVRRSAAARRADFATIRPSWATC